MASSIPQLLIILALGGYIIRFARSTYRHPEKARARWFSQLPAKNWSLKFLRYMSVFWIFGAFILILWTTTPWPFIRDYHGSTLVMLMVFSAAALTTLLVWLTPKEIT